MHTPIVLIVTVLMWLSHRPEYSCDTSQKDWRQAWASVAYEMIGCKRI